MTTVPNSQEPSDAAMAAALKALIKWQTPREFVTTVRSFAPLVMSSTLFNKPNAGFLLDAIPIAELTQHIAMDSLRLTEQMEGLNDGQFKQAGKIIDIEVTEVMEPGRRRGDEYRRGPNVINREFDPNLGKTVDTALTEGVKKKARKNYATKPLLLVYLNIGTGGRLGNEVETAIERIKTEYTESFQGIRVLWANKLY